MGKDKKVEFQNEFDIKKWTESEQAGYDKCGQYEFCAKCDKTKPTPCAEAHFANEIVTLKQSISLAKTETNKEGIDKKYVADYLEKTYKAKVKVNRRANKISSGILPLADTHYVVGDKKVCFIYVYETEGGIMFLIKCDEKFALELKQKHEKVFKSAFPKARKAWYSVIIDDSFTAKDVNALLDELVKENA